MELEAPIAHLPLRRLKFLYTTSTLAIEKDVQVVLAKIQHLKANAATLSAQEASEVLSTLINRLENLQRKVHNFRIIFPLLYQINLDLLRYR